MDVDKALKLKALGCDMDDASHAFTSASNYGYVDYFEVPAHETWLVRSLLFYSSGVRGRLFIDIDKKSIYTNDHVNAVQFATIPLEINEWCKNQLTMSIANREDIDHIISYTLPILRIPDAIYEQAVEVLIG